MSSIDGLTPIARLANAGPEPRWFVRTRLRHHGGFLVLGGEQEQGRDVERRHPVRLPVEPEKVHPGHEDGLRRSQEAGRSRRLDRVPQGEHQVSNARGDVVALGSRDRSDSDGSTLLIVTHTYTHTFTRARRDLAPHRTRAGSSRLGRNASPLPERRLANPNPRPARPDRRSPRDASLDDRSRSIARATRRSTVHRSSRARFVDATDARDANGARERGAIGDEIELNSSILRIDVRRSAFVATRRCETRGETTCTVVMR